ncbi:MAG: hypothetical protein ACPIOQ_47755, partial [Promethearchaeia archaeon]
AVGDCDGIAGISLCAIGDCDGMIERRGSSQKTWSIIPSRYHSSSGTRDRRAFVQGHATTGTCGTKTGPRG